MSREFTHPELAGIEIHGVTRGAFLARGALATAAVYGAGAVGPFVGQALAATTGRQAKNRITG